jgi:predicted glycogen debranching enzyme
MLQRLAQNPAPGSRSLRYRGDLLEVRLVVPGAAEGRAWLRTTLGNAAIRCGEIIRHVEGGAPLRAHEWHDIAMTRIAADTFRLSLPLLEVGLFQAKAFFLPAGQTEPVWPEGGNLRIKVEPAASCCANTLYAAFVRQFRPDGADAITPEQAHTIEALEKDGYAVIPRSGTFRDLIRRLDVILDVMGCRILQLLPIHPTPTTYARMGRFGSPFAVIDFMDVDPSLGEFDRQSTPLDQFRELVHAVHRRGARIFLDIPVNHTGWASKLQNQHPEWFERTPDRAFRSPGAWGVTWEDLSQLNFQSRHLWQYVADVFLYWCGHGVDGFRCDAGYMVPLDVWQYVVARVRERYPDTLFLLEGLGGSFQVTDALLTEAGLDWAYSELFQEYDRWQIERYLPGALRFSGDSGRLVHFAETHDNDRLAAKSEAYARMRTAMSALLADAGGFGITAGVEWFARAKIDVHGAPPLNWGAARNQVDEIRRLNAILRSVPAFHAGADIRLVQTSEGNALAAMRSAADGARCLVLVNLDTAGPLTVAWPAAEFAHEHAVDLLTGRERSLRAQGASASLELAPGEVLCLTPNREDLARLEADAGTGGDPERLRRQVLQALALDVVVRCKGLGDAAGVDPVHEASALARDPAAYCTAVNEGVPCSVSWAWPRDVRRTVPVPAGFMLHLHAPCRFHVEARIGDSAGGRVHAVQGDDGRWFTLLPPPRGPARAGVRATLIVTAFEPERTVHAEAGVVWLPAGRSAVVRRAAQRKDVVSRGLYSLCTNGRGAYAQVQGAWGTIRSQYDALLAANLHPDCPVDRHLMLTRCRMWLVHRGYSQSIDADSLDTFRVGKDGALSWTFTVSAGLGNVVPLTVRLELVQGENRILLSVLRQASRGAHRLADRSAVRLIVRPDIEDRSVHAVTKAYTGPEAAWPGAVRPAADGFDFEPHPGRALRMRASSGGFVQEPEWLYMVPHPFEAERGLEASGDLFSPGYFVCDLLGGQTVCMSAAAGTGSAPSAILPSSPGEASSDAAEEVPLQDAAREMLRHFVVRRGRLKTVIAGYPWFLDWGRDTLIALRGIIAAGATREARDILSAFGAMERDGTLPNLLAGENDANRDTSDAPLWYVVAARDLAAAEGSDDVLRLPCGTRTLLEVMESIAAGYGRGTPNGVRMDPESGLVFSPSHFTWMDTNHPAGTPRQGYPIEIQALWYAALSFLARVGGPTSPWIPLAGRVQDSILKYYVRDGADHLADCLHAVPGQPAAQAAADDHLRPNQLLAVTLGAVQDRAVAARIVRSCEELLVPGAIRSLADRAVTHALPVWHQGHLLNDPHRPYQGRYAGDEDTSRKPAYHNGTAWTWLFPSYAEALYLAYGDPIRPAALSALSGAVELIERDCIGQVPEIVDGDFPHAARGCGAQAWGASELYRVLALLF